MPINNGDVVLGSNPRVYLIKANQRRWIPAPPTLECFGGWSVVKGVDDNELNTFPEGPALPARGNGTALIRASGGAVYIMENWRRRWIPDTSTLETILPGGWNDVQTFPDNDINDIPEGAPIPSMLADGAVLMGTTEGKIFVIKSGQRHWIPDPQTLEQNFGGWGAVRVISDDKLNAIPEGSPEPSVVPDPDIKFEFNWAGAVVILSHNLTQKVLTSTGDSIEVINILTSAAVGVGLVIAPPISAAIGAVSAYINVERQLIKIMDKGNGVYLTCPYPAIWYGQFWIIIPTSR
jgi:hypothetical protein